MGKEKATQPGPSTQSRTCAHTTLLDVDLLQLITHMYYIQVITSLEGLPNYISYIAVFYPLNQIALLEMSPRSPLLDDSDLARI